MGKATPLKAYWLSSNKMTVIVEVNHRGIIVKAAPIVRKFLGQPISNLIKWMKRQGGFKQELLGRE